MISSSIQGNHLALSELIFFLVEIRIINYSLSFFGLCKHDIDWMIFGIFMSDGFFNTYHLNGPWRIALFFFYFIVWIVLFIQYSQPYLYCLRIFFLIYVYVSPCIWCVYFLSFFFFLLFNNIYIVKWKLFKCYQKLYLLLMIFMVFLLFFLF